MARFAAQRFRFPGVEIKARLFRSYPYGELASHVMGYIGRINQAEKERIEDSDEDRPTTAGTDYIGKLGVEQSFEQQLHGNTGVEQVETSAGGRAVRKLASSPATPGDTVMLSIDIKLQKLVEDMYGERRGALVAMDPRNRRGAGLRQQADLRPQPVCRRHRHRKLAGAERVDRQAAAEPGAARHLPARLDLQALHGDGGAADRQARAQHHHQRHRLLHVWRPPFRQPRRRAGLARWTCTAHRQVEQRLLLLAGQRDGRGPDARLHEAAGLRPDHRHRHPRRSARRAAQPGVEAQATTRAPSSKKWYAGETISLGIGQGYNNFTMLQLAQATAIAGQQRRQAQAAPGDRHPGRHDARDARRCQPIRPKTWATSPSNVAVDPQGAGRRDAGGHLGAGVCRRRLPERRQDRHRAGRDHRRRRTKYNAAKLEEHQRDHALYMAFAPADDPKIALAVIVENAGWGAGVGRADCAARVRLLAAGPVPERGGHGCRAEGAGCCAHRQAAPAADMAGAGRGRWFAGPRECGGGRRPSAARTAALAEAVAKLIPGASAVETSRRLGRSGRRRSWF